MGNHFITEDKLQIIRYVEKLAKSGFAPTRLAIKKLVPVNKFVKKELKYEEAFQNKVNGKSKSAAEHDWLRLCMRRHP